MSDEPSTSAGTNGAPPPPFGIRPLLTCEGEPGWWDRQGLRPTHSHSINASKNIRRLLDRVETVERVRLYECAEEERRAIGAELAARIAWWTPPEKTPPEVDGPVRDAMTPPNGIGVLAWLLFTGVAGAAGGALVGVLVGVVLLVVVVGLVKRSLGLGIRKSRCLSDRICPECGYELGGHADGVEAAMIGGVRVGPAKCPECGVAWPLVPPSIPE
jgi:hypothetical protein